jgi:hypothetical protein
LPPTSTATPDLGALGEQYDSITSAAITSAGGQFKKIDGAVAAGYQTLTAADGNPDRVQGAISTVGADLQTASIGFQSLAQTFANLEQNLIAIPLPASIQPDARAVQDVVTQLQIDSQAGVGAATLGNATVVLQRLQADGARYDAANARLRQDLRLSTTSPTPSVS